MEILAMFIIVVMIAFASILFSLVGMIDGISDYYHAKALTEKHMCIEEINAAKP